MIQPGTDLVAWAQEHHVKFVRKDTSRLHRLIGWLMAIVGYDYMNRAWTTIGKTIAYPVTGPLCDINPDAVCLLPEYLEKRRQTIEHEYYHILQRERLWILHDIAYLLFPLPVLLAWYRTCCELRAYAHECAFYDRDQDSVVEVMWRVYGFPWPKAWMRKWLAKEVTFLKAWHGPKVRA